MAFSFSNSGSSIERANRYSTHSVAETLIVKKMEGKEDITSVMLNFISIRYQMASYFK